MRITKYYGKIYCTSEIVCLVLRTVQHNTDVRENVKALKLIVVWLTGVDTAVSQRTNGYES